MDLDLAQLRAFVATAEHLHFGRAAEQLFLTQQALSKRIARLEDSLGVGLFLRGRGGVRLTEAGRRFLAPAREALAAGERAVAAVRQAGRPLRIDVWGHLYQPMRTVRDVMDGGFAELDVTLATLEIGLGRDLPATAAALARGDIDAGLGRVHPLSPRVASADPISRSGSDPPRFAGLTSRVVRLEPVAAVLSVDHRLADASVLRPVDLRPSTLWAPAALDRLDFLQHFADHFGVIAESAGANLGLDDFLAHVQADPECFALLPVGVPLSVGAGVCQVPLVDPTPRYAWSLVWHAADPHPGFGALLHGFAETAARHRWLDYDPSADWLPDSGVVAA